MRIIGGASVAGETISGRLPHDGKFGYIGIQDQDNVLVVPVPDRKIVREFHTPNEPGPNPVLPVQP